MYGRNLILVLIVLVTPSIPLHNGSSMLGLTEANSQFFPFTNFTRDLRRSISHSNALFEFPRVIYYCQLSLTSGWKASRQGWVYTSHQQLVLAGSIPGVPASHLSQASQGFSLAHVLTSAAASSYELSLIRGPNG